MKQFAQPTKLFVLMLMITAVFLAACDVEPVEITQIPLGASPTANLTVTEVAVKIVTPEPTPTTAVCTPLPADMTLDIQYESDLHGTIEVTGLQPGEKPTLLLTGQSKVTSDWWHKDTQYENAVEENGHLSYRFDFRSWPSVEGYTFTGQLIHQRGVACFELEIPQTDDTSDAGRTLNGRLVAAKEETQPLPGVLLRLEPDGEPVTQTDGNGRLPWFWMWFKNEINLGAING